MHSALPLGLSARVLLGFAVFGFAAGSGGVLRSDPTAPWQPAQSERTVVVISDLHMGPGRAGRAWSEYEDFRWPNALTGFLAEIGRLGRDRVDLIVAGDLLDLWQHPSVRCAGPDTDHGCTLAEIEQATDAVVSGHRDDLRQLGVFAERGENHVTLIPGNHDAALMLDSVAHKVTSAMSAAKGRVTVLKSGRWLSSDGRTVVEHGHQVGFDPNRFARWPAVTSRVGPAEYLERPWGEQFVQQLFNAVEQSDPLIDNLQPLSAGVRIYMDRRGIGASPADFGRFLRFNLFQTSLRQKGAMLGSGGADKMIDTRATRRLGHRLFADALADDDPLRVSLLTDTSSQWIDIRKGLDAVAADEQQLSDTEVLTLCDIIDARMKAAVETPPANSRTECATTLGSMLANTIPIARILARHLESLLPETRGATTFVYGHTHELTFDWAVVWDGTRRTDIFNDGAFQRLVDEATLRELGKARGVSYAESLRSIPLEALPACYSAVLIIQDAKEGRKTRLQNWYMQEDDASGQLIDPCDLRCPSARSQACRAGS